jgi:hypothetical protein
VATIRFVAIEGRIQEMATPELPPRRAVPDGLLSYDVGHQRHGIAYYLLGEKIVS